MHSPAGRRTLQVDSRRDSYLYVPQGYDPARPAPLVLLLHGSGGDARQGLQLLEHLAESHGLILLALSSTGPTWDVIYTRSYQADVALIEKALAQVFGQYSVDLRRLAIGGFSDGASYALSLGRANGLLFSDVIAYSPGFIAPAPPEGKPRIFISHGVGDRVLPIDPCSRTIVSRLRKADYSVMYREFDGGHTVPPDVAQRSVDWFLHGT